MNACHVWTAHRPLFNTYNRKFKMSSPTHTISILGLGSMGAALAHTYLKANFQVTAWNRTRDRKEVTEIIEAGATVLDSMESAILSTRIIIICVLNYNTIHGVLKDLPATALASKTVINLTNGTPNEARSMSAWMKQRGAAAYIDGGIMAVPPSVGTEQAFIFYSGEQQTEVDKIRDFLRPLGRINYVGQDPGAAALHDLALLSGMYGMQAGAMTAMALLRKVDGGGQGLATIVEEKLIPWMQALLPPLADTARRFEGGDFDAYGHPNAMVYSSLCILMRTCADEGVEAGALEAMAKAVGNTVEEEGGDKGLALVVQKFLKQ